MKLYSVQTSLYCISLVFVILLIVLIKQNVTEKFIGKQRKKRVMTFIINGFNNKKPGDWVD